MHEFSFNWKQSVSSSNSKCNSGRNKLRTYSTFKNTFITEHYVKSNISRCQRSALAKFRAGVAPLRIETGRYENIPPEHRYCFICKDTVEDESHVLLQCPFMTILDKFYLIQRTV